MDLNITIECDGERDSDQIIRQKVDRCLALGFKAIALNVIIDAQDKSPKVPPPPDVSGLASNRMKIYTRLTATVSETIQLYKLGKSSETSKYDLFAIEPRNTKILQYVASGSGDLDILTFDISERLDYSIFKARYKLLEDRGICVEINYGPAQLNGSMRRNTICNGQNLVEKTSKYILLSSGVKDVFRIRGPKDAKSLGVLFMLPLSKCHDAVFNNGHLALQHAKHRKNPSSSAIEFVGCVE